MNVVSFGGGTNSTAMLIGMRDRGIKPDLILFADTGAEMPHTYEHIKIMDEWLKKQGFPKITQVHCVDKNGERVTIERDCLEGERLPAIAFGYRTCSHRFKIEVQNKYCNNHELCKDVWKVGEKVEKWIGFDAGEESRKEGAAKSDEDDKKYNRNYPLIDWGWYRRDCARVIQKERLKLPGKSSCFFCPNMKKDEIFRLKQDYPDLLKRAIAVEDNAQNGLTSVKGLGRNWAWRDLVYADKNQVGMCGLVDYEDDTPCGCYDG